MRPRVEQRAALVGRLCERLVAKRAEAREQHEQRAARDGADGIELQAADPLRHRRDRVRAVPEPGRAGPRAGEPLRVQRQPPRLRDRDRAPLLRQIPSPGKNSFVNARCAVCELGSSFLSAIHCA